MLNRSGVIAMLLLHAKGLSSFGEHHDARKRYMNVHRQSFQPRGRRVLPSQK
jgi:hypothetical protein